MGSSNIPNLAADVVEVYQDNFFQEMDRIALLANQYNYVSMVSNNQFNNIKINLANHMFSFRIRSFLVTFMKEALK